MITTYTTNFYLKKKKETQKTHYINVYVRLKMKMSQP